MEQKQDANAKFVSGCLMFFGGLFLIIVLIFIFGGKEADSATETQEIAAPATIAHIYTVEERVDFGKELRDNFLDAALDIEVEVYGKKKDKMKLRYVLFNAVWARKLEKEGFINKLRERGFVKLELTDSYKYNVHYDLK